MTNKAINEFSTKTYGYGICEVCPTTALWVVEKILRDTGKNVYRKVSQHRNKIGRGTSFPVYGSEVFKSM